MRHLGIPTEAERFTRLGPAERATAVLRPVRRRLTVGAAIGLIAIVAYAALVVVQPSPSSPTKPVTLVAGTWAPFVGPDLDADGPVAQIVFEALQQDGLEPKMQYTSWATAADRVAGAEVLATFPYIASEERRSRFYLSDPIIEFEYVLFYSTVRWPDPPSVDVPSDLADLRIGRAEGYDVWSELDDAVEQFIEFDTPEDAFAALAAGDIDLLPEGRLPGQAILESSSYAADIGRVAVLDDPGNPLVESAETLHLMAPRTPEGRTFLSRFDASLAQVRESSFYDDIVAGIQPGSGGQLVDLLAGSDGVVELYEVPVGGSPVLAPLGTAGRVVAWPDSFTVGSAAASVERIEVKLSNGPMKGRILYVEPTTVQLVEDDG